MTIFKLRMTIFKLSIVTLITISLMGCFRTGQSSAYRNFEHMKFSIYGHKNPTPEDLKKSEEQKWFGKEVVVEERGDATNAQIEKLAQVVFYVIEGKEMYKKRRPGLFKKEVAAKEAKDRWKILRHY